MHLKHHIGLVIALLGAGCAPLPDGHPLSTVTWQRPADTGTDLSPDRLGALMGQVAALDDVSAQKEIARLESGVVQSSAADRLKLAYLLSLESSRLEDQRQADALLEDLISDLENGDTRILVRLLQSNIRLQLLLGEERSKAAELTRKIQQIKGLEKELQQHNFTTDPPHTSPDK
jgi:hypothetical protein